VSAPGPLHRFAAGTAAGSTLALALLVCGCVFAAMAGPAVSLHTRTQALHQTLAGLTGTTKTVQVSTPWGEFTSPVFGSSVGSQQDLTPSLLAMSLREIGHGLAATPLPLAAGGWASLSTNLIAISSGAPARAQAGAPPRLEVLYRDPLLSNAQVTAGTFATTAAPAGALAVAATAPTAARFGLHPGSRLTLTTVSGPVRLFVTAIVRERAAGSTFWTQDPTAGAPSLVVPHPFQGLPYWVGGVFADPDQLGAMQNTFSGPGMELNWEFPLAVGGENADQAQRLENALNRATSTPLPLTGSLAAGADSLTVTSPLIPDLSQFLGTQAGIETVLLLLFVSLVVVGAAVILLAARMIVARRDGELATVRARGGSVRQVAAVMLRSAAIAAIPAALIGAGLAIALVPGGAASLRTGWVLAGIAVLAALAGPPLIAVWRHRSAAPASNPALLAETGRPARPWRRPVAEITACAAAVAGLFVLHDQGLPAGGGINLYLTVTPVLVAIPVVLVMLRLYPLAVRGLLAASARRAGATGFVALSRAARSSLIGLLPAFALVLALSLTSFAGMVSDGITRGEVAASWQTTGADAAITTGPESPPVSAAAVRAIAAVRGVRAATAVWNTSWVTPGGQPVTVVAVDPAGYAAVVADTPFPAFPTANLSSGATVSSGGTAAVLASPSAAAILGTAAVQLTSVNAVGPVKVRVAATLGSTPALPGGGTFVVMPLETLPGLTGQPAPNLVLVTGASIDQAQLAAVASQVIPGSFTTFRSSVLASLASSPLQHGAALVVALTIATTAAFGLLIVILGLALGSAERELTVARLTIMGHQRTTRLVMTEALPAVLAAVVAGAACAAVLPRVIGSSIDLSAFTGTGAPVQFSPDATAFGLPAATIVVLALAVLTAETRTLRRHGITGILRAS
jgi:putative ABC transport system permease protein